MRGAAQGGELEMGSKREQGTASAVVASYRFPVGNYAAMILGVVGEVRGRSRGTAN